MACLGVLQAEGRVAKGMMTAPRTGGASEGGPGGGDPTGRITPNLVETVCVLVEDENYDVQFQVLRGGHQAKSDSIF